MLRKGWRESGLGVNGTGGAVVGVSEVVGVVFFACCEVRFEGFAIVYLSLPIVVSRRSLEVGVGVILLVYKLDLFSAVVGITHLSCVIVAPGVKSTGSSIYIYIN